MIYEAKGDSVQIARMYMDSLLVESRIVGAVYPDTTFRFLGETFEMPVMTAALSHLDLVAMAEGAKEAGACVSIGMGGNEEMGNEREIMSRLEYAEANGAAAVGMDVEHAVNVEDAENSVVVGLQMKQPTLAELEKYIRATKLPFFIKGALSAQDALRCRDLGAAGLILSHHNGLMRYAVPPVMILPEIRKAIGRDLILIADGGIESGFDAFKALARGADAVTVGKALMGPLKETGANGVRDALKKIAGQLQAMMIRTGTKDLKHMDPSVIHETLRF